MAGGQSGEEGAMDRKRYWNEQYLHYWRERTSARGAQVIRGDSAPADVKLFEHYLEQLRLRPGERVLEVGIGFGRLVPSLLKYSVDIYGIDISPQMIAEARSEWMGQVADLQEAEAEDIPYQDAFFDAVVCWAVFDACFQEEALAEMARVLRVGGRLLLTGKHDDYWDDDELAYTAEVNARAKGHPNYFTHFPALAAALPELGLQLERAFYFERRGDLAINRYLLAPPPHFYEYMAIVR
jgi:SAM-dependent methyltransferase